MNHTGFDWLTPAEIAANGVAKLERRTAERAAREHLLVCRLVATPADPAEFPYLAERGPDGGGLLFRIDIDADDLVLKPVNQSTRPKISKFWNDSPSCTGTI